LQGEQPSSSNTQGADASGSEIISRRKPSALYIRRLGRCAILIAQNVYLQNKNEEFLRERESGFKKIYNKTLNYVLSLDQKEAEAYLERVGKRIAELGLDSEILEFMVLFLRLIKADYKRLKTGS